MKRQYVISIIAAFLATLGCNAQPRTINRTTVTTLDINRYMGKWYEIARFDHRFERGMEYVTATYTLLQDGTVEVKNHGLRDNKEHISMGHAKTTRNPGQLRVSFFWKFYSDYNILAIAPNGEWMMIGSSSPKYLWILSRTPTLPQKQLDYIIALAAQRGYNTNKLIFVKQN